MAEVRIKQDRYGHAISLLLQEGSGFQTRFERTLIVNAKQQRILEDADVIASNGAATQEGASP